MGFSKKVVLKTIEVADLVPKGNFDIKLTARIEILQSDENSFSCNVFFAEDYRMLPTIYAIGQYESLEELTCDKCVYTLEKSLDFDEIAACSAGTVEELAMRKLCDLFEQHVAGETNG